MDEERMRADSRRPPAGEQVSCPVESGSGGETIEGS